MIPGASTDKTKENDVEVPRKHKRDTSDDDNDETDDIERKKVST